MWRSDKGNCLLLSPWARCAFALGKIGSCLGQKDAPATWVDAPPSPPKSGRSSFSAARWLLCVAAMKFGPRDGRSRRALVLRRRS